MHPTHELWEEISQCDTPNKMKKKSWEKLQGIAEAMIATDFRRGSEAELGRKLLLALKYSDFGELRSALKIEDYVQFIHDIAKIWDRDMNYVNIFNKNTKVFLAGCLYSEESLKNKFYLEVLPTLGLCTLKKDKQGEVIESLLLFFCDEALAGETPMETYRRWREDHPGEAK